MAINISRWAIFAMRYTFATTPYVPESARYMREIGNGDMVDWRSGVHHRPTIIRFNSPTISIVIGISVRLVLVLVCPIKYITWHYMTIGWAIVRSEAPRTLLDQVAARMPIENQSLQIKAQCCKGYY